MMKNKTLPIGAVAALCLMAIFAPDLEVLSIRSRSSHEDVIRKFSRKLNEITNDLAPAPRDMALSCSQKGYEPYRVDWSRVIIEDDVAPQTVTLPNGMEVKLTVTDTGTGRAHSWGRDDNGYLYFTAGQVPDETDVIDNGAVPEGLAYPESYSTLSFEFDSELEGLYISISDVDSNKVSSDAVRIRMLDANGSPVAQTITKTGDIQVIDNFGFEGVPNVNSNNPGLEFSLYAKALGPVKTISLDQSVFIFRGEKVGVFTRRTVFPGLDWAYCAPKMPPTLPPAEDAGVNGDPLIMGLAGQLFKFEGRSGAWYSSVSAPTFQWNMKVQKYEKCPAYSNNFISGVGFSFYDSAGKVLRKIEVAVSNPYEVNVGCGADNVKNCLGDGSLEIVLDGVKIVTGGDFKFSDGSGRIIAFNTFHDCSRKWYDFDVTPAAGAKDDRRLSNVSPSVFQIIENLKDTMTEKESCNRWLALRKVRGDLFEQPGHYSTVIITNEDVNLHIEYKQEHERCNAHSIDVWISHVSPELLKEDWEGVIGETKDPSYKVEAGITMDREEVLKYSEDEAYEVNGPFSNECKGCASANVTVTNA